MVRKDLAARGIVDRRVLAAMATVPREAFIDPAAADSAYVDAPLTIGCGQTIRQPYMVALMTEAAQLTRRARVLEIGTGSGYHAAVLAHLSAHVWTVERITKLADRAERNLAAERVENVTVVVADGAAGHRAAAPYDAIVVAAAAPEAPTPLLDQIAPGGRLVIPVGDADLQHLTVVEKSWFEAIFSGRDVDYGFDFDADRDAEWHLGGDETIGEAVAAYEAQIAVSNEIVASSDLDAMAEKEIRGERYSLRWIVVHMIEETARHAGHADILREHLDGSLGYLPEL